MIKYSIKTIWPWCALPVIAIACLLMLWEIIRRKETSHFLESERAFNHVSVYFKTADSPCTTYEAMLSMLEEVDPDIILKSISASEDRTPLPFYFPEGRRYKLIARLPKGADSAKVPLIWDTRPSPRCRRIAIIFYDGHLPEDMFGEKDLKAALDYFLKHGGTSTDINDAVSCVDPSWRGHASEPTWIRWRVR